jgi:hypothetical protein
MLQEEALLKAIKDAENRISEETEKLIETTNAMRQAVADIRLIRLRAESAAKEYKGGGNV